MGIEAGSSTYYQAKRGIVQDGLVLHLDAGVKESHNYGDTWNDILNDKTASAINGTIFTRNNGGSIKLDGTNDYLIYPRYMNLVGDQTLEAWFKADANGVTHRTIVTTCTTYQYGVKLMNFKNYNRWGLWLGFGSTNYVAMNTENLNDGGIYNIAGSWDRSTGYVYLYKNGQFITSINTGQTADIAFYAFNTSYAIGVDYHSSSYFSGDIYSTRIYNRVLSDVEITQNYNATRHRFGL